MVIEGGILFFVLLPVLGFVVGVYGSFAGVGGGVVLTPVLSLAFGLSYPEAIACTMAQMVGMSASAVLRHWRLGHIDWKLAAFFLVGSLPGAALGRILLQRLDAAHGGDAELRSFFNVLFLSLLLLSMAGGVIKLWRRHRKKGRPPRPSRRARLRTPTIRSVILVVSGVLTGGLAGMLSLGGGIVSLPVLVGLLGIPVTVAVATSLLQMSLSAVVATATSIGSGTLNWPVIGLLTLGSVPGATLGPILLGAAAKKLRRRKEARAVRDGTPAPDAVASVPSAPDAVASVPPAAVTSAAPGRE